MQFSGDHTDIFNFNRLNSYLISLSFTSDWLWNGVCQNAVSSIIDITMTTINKKKSEIYKGRILSDLDLCYWKSDTRNVKFGV